jgi:hypothetical protein
MPESIMILAAEMPHVEVPKMTGNINLTKRKILVVARFY